MARPDPDIASRRLGAGMADHSDPQGDFAALSRDRIPVRSMTEDDLAWVVRIDRKLTGSDRSAYYGRKLREVMRESGIRVSLVAELDGTPVGFVMARVDFGEFGRTEPAAIIDTIGVDPGHAGHGVGRALLSQLLTNLVTLRVETVRTLAAWDDFQLLGFLESCGFAPGQQVVFTKRVV